MYAWPCKAVMFDLAIKNESYLALKCGMNQPCPSLFIALVHLWKHDLVTSIYSLISALCVFHNINIWCKYVKYGMFMKYISILCKYIHSTWTWTFWMKPPRPAASSLSMYLWAVFLSALSHNSISISIWIDIAFYIQSKSHLRPHYFHFFTRL